MIKSIGGRLATAAILSALAACGSGRDERARPPASSPSGSTYEISAGWLKGLGQRDAARMAAYSSVPFSLEGAALVPACVGIEEARTGAELDRVLGCLVSDATLVAEASTCSPVVTEGRPVRCVVGDGPYTFIDLTVRGGRVVGVAISRGNGIADPQP